MDKKEVVITGIGLATPLGIGKNENWINFCNGKSGIDTIKGFDTSQCVTQFGGELPEKWKEMSKEFFSKRLLKQVAEFTQLGMLTTELALEDSGIDIKQENPKKIGISFGNNIAGIKYIDDNFVHNHNNTKKKVELDSCVKLMPQSIIAQVSINKGIKGPMLLNANGCAAGAYAIGLGTEMIRSGKVDIVIAGGVDIALTPLTIKSFNRLDAISVRNDNPANASRPFDKERDGFVLSNGAGLLVLESEEHANKRECQIYAKLKGYAFTSESYQILHPEPNGIEMAETMWDALEDAQVNPDEIDYISAHGTSTIANDLSETLAIKHVFKDTAYNLQISSQKSMMGHPISASGSIEVAICALTIQNDIITPTINYENQDEKLDLNYTPNYSIDKEVNIALSNSFALGGCNCSIILSKYGYK